MTQIVFNEWDVFIPGIRFTTVHSINENEAGNYQMFPDLGFILLQPDSTGLQLGIDSIYGSPTFDVLGPALVFHYPDLTAEVVVPGWERVVLRNFSITPEPTTLTLLLLGLLVLARRKR